MPFTNVTNNTMAQSAFANATAGAGLGEPLGGLNNADHALWAIAELLGPVSTQSGETGVTRPTYPVGDVRRYGAAGDGVTDDTTAIQNAINSIAALGGGRVFVPRGTYVCVGLTLPSFVTLSGEIEWTYLPNGVTAKGSTLQQKPTGGTVLSLANTYPTRTNSANVKNLVVRGNGSAVAGRGISFGASAFMCGIEGCYVWNFADEGVYFSGTAGRFRHNLVALCVLNFASLAAFKGAVTIAGSDHEVHYCEVQTSSYQGRAAGSLNTVTSANRYCVAWLVTSSAGFFTSCTGELSDIGWVIYGPTGVGAFGTDELAYGATDNRFTGCRGDRNAAQGWFLTNKAARNQFANCLALSNCSGGLVAADGQYDQWVIGTSASDEEGNQFTNCGAYTVLDSFAPYRPRYGWLHAAGQNASASRARRNHFVNCTSANHLTRWFMDTSTTYGDDLVPWPTVPVLGSHTVFQAPDQDATPSVDQTEVLVLVNSLATTITNFTNGYNGQRILVFDRAGNNTTIQNNAGLVTRSTRDIALRQNELREFYRLRGVWYEMGTARMTGQTTYDPPSLVDGAGTTTSVTATGAALGDYAYATFSLDTQGITITAWVSAADTVSVRLQNESGGTLDIASGTLRVRVEKS